MSTAPHLNQFTFQYGEIKSLPAGNAQMLCTAFTFQYGEIKSGTGSNLQ